MTVTNRATQQRLPLGRAPSLTRRDFIVSPANAEAVEALDAWPAWPGGCLALIGPEGSGKTHLARIWASRADATIIDRGEVDLSSVAGRPVLVEDADRRSADEMLFHLINMAETGSQPAADGTHAAASMERRPPRSAIAPELPDGRILASA